MAEPGPTFQPPGFERKSLLGSRGRINYYESRPEQSSRRRTLVFLHGFGGGSSSYEWSKVYPAFTAEHRVLAPDLPGWGFSERRATDYTPEDYRIAMREFIEDVGEGPVIAVASSVVGGLTLWLATEHSELFAGIVAMNPAGLKDFGRPYNGNLFGIVSSLPLVGDLTYNQFVANRGAIRGFLRTALFAQENRIYDEIVEAYYAVASQPDSQYAAYSFLKGNLAFDLAQYLPKLTVSTALLWGALSTYASPELGKRLAALSPQVKRFEIIEDTGLTPQLELPGVTVAAIRRGIRAIVPNEATIAV